MSKILGSYEEALQVAKTLAAGFAKTAAARDKSGGTPAKELDLIKSSGLLNFFIAKEHGGTGGNWKQLIAIFTEFARVDSSLAHLFAFHNYQLATVRLYGAKEQWTKLHRDTAANGWFWANALNQLKRDVIATKQSDGSYRWNGVKTFATGSKSADYITITGSENSEEGKTLAAAIPTKREGVEIEGDWDNIGQRQTDSGRLFFYNVRVEASEILSDPGPLSTPFSSFRPLIGQLFFGNLFLSVAEGAFAAAINYVRGKETRPWLSSIASSAQKDPLLLRRLGEALVDLESARALVDRVNDLIDPVWAKAEALSEQERGEFAIAVAKSRAAATKTALAVTSGIFDALGSRATTRELGFDRFWRNARTQTLHDPIDYKLVAIGDHALNGDYPAPSFYS
ncbi:MAG: acyl-CoA dehydrogenase family protein [Helicobacteraceae bacterium]|jgi:alkylation response protein AidB-like acyl-CoA dehydrogenase|nr:acyl-CoA dehydrogenase family protein [Helicobacteraceae bacterium]